MKVALDGRGINWYRGTGIGTYTFNVFKRIIDKDTKNFYNIFWSGENYNKFKRDNTSIYLASNRHQRFFENNYIPSFIKENNIDLYHIPQNGIGLSNNIDCKKIVTIHDLIPYILPETVGKGYLKKFLDFMPKIIENSSAIITVSEYSKKDIIKFFPNFPKDKIFVTPLAADKKFIPLDKDICRLDIQKKYNFSTPYLLYIGGFSARKNVCGLIKGFKNSLKSLNKKISLVIAGSLKDDAKSIIDLINSLDLKDKVILTGFIEDEYLPILYNGSEGFIYPSYYEGFGLPPLEAMSCKIPVITSNVTSIPEVVKDCGILIDPSKEDSLSEAIETIINNEDFRNFIAEKGYKRSKDFSWDKTAENTLSVYKDILK